LSNLRELIELCIVANFVEASFGPRRKASGRIDGSVGPTAAEHNAPRGKLQRSEAGEPIYGERDKVDLQEMRELGQAARFRLQCVRTLL